MSAASVTGFTAVEVRWMPDQPDGLDGRPNISIREATGRAARVWLSEGEQQPRIRDTVRFERSGEWMVQGPSRAVMDEALPRSSGLFFGVAAAWPVSSGAGQQFYDAAILNAVSSVAEEEGCVLFCVVSSLLKQDSFSLIELFQDEKSFQAHMDTPHFAAFAEVARPIYVGDRSDTVRGMVEWTP